jgi:hypothetical protein
MPQNVSCPYCAADIPAGALACRFCGRDVALLLSAMRERDELRARVDELTRRVAEQADGPMLEAPPAPAFSPAQLVRVAAVGYYALCLIVEVVEPSVPGWDAITVDHLLAMLTAVAGAGLLVAHERTTIWNAALLGFLEPIVVRVVRAIADPSSLETLRMYPDRLIRASLPLAVAGALGVVLAALVHRRRSLAHALSPKPITSWLVGSERGMERVEKVLVRTGALLTAASPLIVYLSK